MERQFSDYPFKLVSLQLQKAYHLSNIAFEPRREKPSPLPSVDRRGMRTSPGWGIAGRAGLAAMVAGGVAYMGALLDRPSLALAQTEETCRIGVNIKESEGFGGNYRVSVLSKEDQNTLGSVIVNPPRRAQIRGITQPCNDLQEGQPALRYLVRVTYRDQEQTQEEITTNNRAEDLKITLRREVGDEWWRPWLIGAVIVAVAVGITYLIWRFRH